MGGGREPSRSRGMARPTGRRVRWKSSERLHDQGRRQAGPSRYIQRMVKRYASKAGIEKDITLHTLRHSFATDLYRKTTNIRLTQKALGHSNLATTQIYTHIVDDELEGALKSFRTATVRA